MTGTEKKFYTFILIRFYKIVRKAELMKRNSS